MGPARYTDFRDAEAILSEHGTGFLRSKGSRGRHLHPLSVLQPGCPSSNGARRRERASLTALRRFDIATMGRFDSAPRANTLARSFRSMWSYPGLTDTPLFGQPGRCAMSGTGGQPYSPEFQGEMVGLARAGRSPESLGREFEPSAQSRRFVTGRSRGSWTRVGAATYGEAPPPSAPQPRHLTRGWRGGAHPGRPPERRAG